MSEIKTWQEREQDAIGYQAISPASNVIHMRAEIDELRAELEIERMRLAACGVAALGYFEGCNEEYKSASLDDVLQLKTTNDELRAKLAALAEDVVTEEMKMAVRWAPSSAYWSTVLVNHFGPDARDGINSLEKQLREQIAAAGAAPVPEGWRSAVAMAYGHLWHINNEPMAPIPLRSEESASYAARKLLRDLLTTEERGEAINSVRAMLAAAPKEPTP